MHGIGLAFFEDSIVMAAVEKTKAGVILTSCAGASVPSSGFKNALAEVLRESRTRVKDAAISIPDTAVKGVVLEFDELPDNRQEAVEVIKWKAAKGFLARPEDCIVSYQTIRTSNGKKVFAAIADRKIIEGYEDAVSGAGVGVSAVGIHSLNVLNLFSESTADEANGSFFAVTASKSFFSVMAVRDGAIDFYRCKDAGEGEDDIKQVEATFASYKGKNPDADMSKAYIFGSGHSVGAGGFPGRPILRMGTPAKEIPVEKLVSLGKGVNIGGISPLGVISAAGAAAVR